jgi:hypothetical protein
MKSMSAGVKNLTYCGVRGCDYILITTSATITSSGTSVLLSPILGTRTDELFEELWKGIR